MNTKKEEKEMKAIFKAFRPYIDSQDYFDIVYSKKFGFIRIRIDDEYCDEEPQILDTPKKMLGALFNDIINDVVYSPDNPKKEHEDFTLTGYEEAESRRRIAAILKAMKKGDRARYFKLLDAYIEEYQEGGLSDWDDDE